MYSGVDLYIMARILNGNANNSQNIITGSDT